MIVFTHSADDGASRDEGTMNNNRATQKRLSLHHHEAAAASSSSSSNTQAATTDLDEGTVCIAGDDSTVALVVRGFVMNVDDSRHLVGREIAPMLFGCLI